MAINLFFTAIYGSQNYGLDNENSDIDTKTTIIPTIDDLIKGKETSKTVETKYGQDDQKDVRVMFEQLKKCNLSYLEILLDNLPLVNLAYRDEYDNLIKMRDRILLRDLTRLSHSVKGMAYNKRDYTFKIYPTTKNNIEKYGYDGKNASHILRLEGFLNKVLRGRPFQECYNAKTYNNYQEIVDIKNHLPNKDEVKTKVDKSVIRIDEMVNNTTTVKIKGVEEDLDEIAYKLIRKSVEHEIKGFDKNE